MIKNQAHARRTFCLILSFKFSPVARSTCGWTLLEKLLCWYGPLSMALHYHLPQGLKLVTQGTQANILRYNCVWTLFFVLPCSWRFLRFNCSWKALRQKTRVSAFHMFVIVRLLNSSWRCLTSVLFLQRILLSKHWRQKVRSCAGRSCYGRKCRSIWSSQSENRICPQ